MRLRQAPFPLSSSHIAAATLLSLARMLALLLLCGCLVTAAAIAAKPAPLPENEPLPEDVQAALDNPDPLGQPAVLYSLNPRLLPAAQWGKGKDLQGFAIIGKTTLKPEQSLAARVKIKADTKAWDGMIAMCFSPRHALTVKSKGARYDFIICYECHRMSIFRDGKEIASNGIGGSPKGFNEMLKAAGAPLPPEGPPSK